MKKFTLFWRFDKAEVVEGESIEDAFVRSGYGGGAVAALDFHMEGDGRDQYVWNTETHEWDRTTPLPIAQLVKDAVARGEL